MGLLSCLGLAPSSEVRVKRYKLLVPNIYPVKTPLGLDETIPKTISKKISKLVDYVELNPQRIPKVSLMLERNLERDAASSKSKGNVKITVEAFRQLMAASPASALLYIPSLVRLVQLLLKPGQGSLQAQGMLLLDQFIQSQQVARSWDQVEGFLPMVCKVALSSPSPSPSSSPPHLTALRSLRSIMQLGDSLGQPPQDMDLPTSVLLTYALGITGGAEEARVATEALEALGKCCRSASSARRLLDSAFAFLDTASAWQAREPQVAAALAALRSAFTQHGLSHLICNALLRHATRTKQPPEAAPVLLRLASLEGDHLDPLASSSAVAQCLRYFPDHLGAAASPTLLPLFLQTTETLAARVPEAEELLITLGSASEQVTLDSPAAPYALQLLAAAAKPLHRALQANPARTRGLLRSSSLLHRLTGLVAAPSASPAVRQLALELLLGLLRASGAPLGLSHVSTLLSGLWGLVTCGVAAGDERALKAAEELAGEVVANSRGDAESCALIYRFLLTLYRAGAEEGPVGATQSVLPGPARPIAFAERILLLQWVGAAAQSVGRYHGNAAQLTRFAFTYNKGSAAADFWNSLRPSLDYMGLQRALMALVPSAAALSDPFVPSPLPLVSGGSRDGQRQAGDRVQAVASTPGPSAVPARVLSPLSTPGTPGPMEVSPMKSAEKVYYNPTYEKQNGAQGGRAGNGLSPVGMGPAAQRMSPLEVVAPGGGDEGPDDDNSSWATPEQAMYASCDSELEDFSKSEVSSMVDDGAPTPKQRTPGATLAATVPVKV